ncbi:MAG TPA: TauD/TfdA family dioxygenase [Myxococcota bacterium]|nr:TauD/TfdA family dioxygenase [Myxococcota bacterium]
MLEIREPEAGFGVAEARGVEPGRGDDAPALRAALARSGVLCVRMPAPLSDGALQAVARLFGPIKDPLARTREGGTFRYSEARQIIDSGFVMTDELREKLAGLSFGGLDDRRPGLFETFHVDDTYVAEPAAATVLHARALPPSGGGPTCFLDMRGALERLDADTRARIEGLRVVYHYDNDGAFPPRRAAKGPADVLEEVAHPLVRTHPVAGTRSLYLDLDRAKHVEGMPVAEGRALLQRLQDHAEASAPACRHDWRDHDVLVWDNASVQHKAGGDFALGEPRRFWRYMIEGGRPV